MHFGACADGAQLPPHRQRDAPSDPPVLQDWHWSCRNPPYWMAPNPHWLCRGTIACGRIQTTSLTAPRTHEQMSKAAHGYVRRCQTTAAVCSLLSLSRRQSYKKFAVLLLQSSCSPSSGLKPYFMRWRSGTDLFENPLLQRDWLFIFAGQTCTSVAALKIEKCGRALCFRTWKERTKQQWTEAWRRQ